MSPIERPRRARGSRGFGRRGLASACLVIAAGLSATAVSATTASAAAPAAATRTAPAAKTTAASPAARLNIDMQSQQQTNWCWAASGDTIASWFGYSYSQNQFCDAAFGYSQNSSCPNDQATLADDQTAYQWMGLDPGDYIQGTLSWSGVQREINAKRPVQTRIQWSSGGGHMEVIYGYDTSDGYVYWGDPWPDDNRYNWATYDYYTDNSDFSWTHTLYGIGA
ncbi:papain-like cysteine protease family protein [Streptomyces sp. ICBB 8177]|uniref:papain-like cysteine protease family protein n=1 Tax=Streptomyces sp. ICBB 8177 TaxID=563922 RepID=UPI000D67FC6A|nr:papain-like cysteine protease family protein [Streptomyces sp. ICBB 8177]PWI43500.1 hypothetical protein CK485_15325 [Streptomyces sp. ICBB 8177]